MFCFSLLCYTDILSHLFFSGGHKLAPDFNRAAKIVLTDFRDGSLGKINLDSEFTKKLSAARTKT